MHRGRPNHFFKYDKIKRETIKSNDRDKLKEAEKQLIDKEDKIRMLVFKTSNYML